jgi:hypothetical protein
VLQHFHVGLWPVPLFKLPHVYDVSVQNNLVGLYTFKVAEQFFGMATEGA